MPVIETNLAAGSPLEKELYQELVAELRNPKTSGQPAVEIKQMKRDGLRHVYVIWDKWQDCPPEARSSVIRDAFAEVKGPSYERSIAITFAATVPEAGESGWLPYLVQPFGRHKLTPTQAQEVRAALLQEGASPPAEGDVPVLRFATMEQAEEAVGRLKQSAPAFDWNVVITAPSPG